MRNHKYPSDVTDEQWALIEPLIPVYPGGRPRKTDVRDVLDAIFYLLRAGCQWRYLPKDFPPKSTVWGYFDRWRHNGTLDDIHDTLRDQVRKKAKPLLSTRQVQEILVEILQAWEVFVGNAVTIISALQIEERFRISFWDALILSAAHSSSATILYTEDLNHGQRYGNVRVTNPFKS
jgi:transposase